MVGLRTLKIGIIWLVVTSGVLYICSDMVFPGKLQKTTFQPLKPLWKRTGNVPPFQRGVNKCTFLDGPAFLAFRLYNYTKAGMMRVSGATIIVQLLEVKNR